MPKEQYIVIFTCFTHIKVWLAFTLVPPLQHILCDDVYNISYISSMVAKRAIDRYFYLFHIKGWLAFTLVPPLQHIIVLYFNVNILCIFATILICYVFMYLKYSCRCRNMI